MKLIKFFCACFLITAFVEVQSVAQRAKPSQSPCSKTDNKPVWIKVQGEDSLIEATMYRVDKDDINYCLGKGEDRYKPMNKVEAIYFFDPKRRQTAANNNQSNNQGGSGTPNTGSGQSGYSPARILSQPWLPHRTYSSVTLLVELKEDRTVGDVVLKSGSNQELINSAKVAAKTLSFDPAKNNGVPITVIEKVEFTFSPAPPTSVSASDLIPKLLRPQSADNVERKAVKLEWVPVPKAKFYKVLVSYSEAPKCGGWVPKYLENAVTDKTYFDLPYLGNRVACIKWEVETISADGRSEKSPYRIVYYN